MRSADDIVGSFKEDIDKADRRLSSLHEKMLQSWELLTNKQFEMDSKKGNYENVTTNKATTLGNKVIGKLSNGRPAFSFKLETSSEVLREKLSKTERFIYAALGKADAHLKNPISGGSVHGALSYYAPIFGGVIPRVILWEDKDGEVVFDVAFFNPYYTYWAMGADGVSWIAHKRWASTDEIEELYPDASIKEDIAKEGYVEVYDYLNSTLEGVIIDEQWADEPYEHKIGHIPALILPAGNRPLVQMGDTDGMSHSWLSVFDSNRNLYATESMMMTLRKTMLLQQFNRPFIHSFDSTKGGKATDPEFNPSIPGQMTHIDEGKGEKLIPSIPLTLTRDMEISEKQIESDILMGGMSPISWGQGESGEPAAGIAMKLDADADIMKPFRKCIEQAHQWIAMEFIRQVKNGNFKKVIEADGFNGKNERFSLSIKPDELEDKKEVVCEVQMSSQIEGLQNVGMARQLTDGDNPLLSRQTARDSLLQALVPDTDAEEERVMKEKVLKAFPELEILLMLAAVLKDKGKGEDKDDLIKVLLNKRDEIMNKVNPPAPSAPPVGAGGLPMGGVNPMVGANPMGMVAGMQQSPSVPPPRVNVPPGISNAMRLNKMGLSYAGR